MISNELNPNYIVLITYSTENLALFLAELSSKSIRCDTRPSYDSKTIYIFANDKRHILPSLVKNYSFVQCVRSLYDVKTTKHIHSIANTFIKFRLFPTDDDLEKLSIATSNPEISLYFAFLKTYIRWLMPLATVGLLFHYFNKTSSYEVNWIYSLVSLIWGITFVSVWKYKLGPKYSHYLRYKCIRAENLSKYVFIKKLCSIPVVLLFVTFLISLQVICFIMEIFIAQLYGGPLKLIVSFLPTIFLSISIHILKYCYGIFVNFWVQWENSPNISRSLAEKNFVLTFLASYIPLFITLFAYLPFGYLLNPHMNLITEFGNYYNIPLVTTEFKVDIQRCQTQFFYFTITSQIISILLENILPAILERIILKFKNKTSRALTKKIDYILSQHYPDEKKFLYDIKNHILSPWSPFDIDESSCRLVIQYGYIMIFSVMWTLTPLIYVFLNIINLKLDLWRYLVKTTPEWPKDTYLSNYKQDDDDVVPLELWTSILKFINWVAILVSPTLVLMYRYSNLPGIGVTTVSEGSDSWFLYSPLKYSWSYIFICAVLYEHVGFFVSWIIEKLVSKSTHVYRGFVPDDEQMMSSKSNIFDITKKTNIFMAKLLSDQNRNSINIKNNSPGLLKTSGMQLNKFQKSDISVRNRLISDTKPTTMHSVPSDTINKTHKNSALISSFVEALPILETKESTVSSSSIAGATLPEIIPTSRNYDLRHSHPLNICNKIDHIVLPHDGQAVSNNFKDEKPPLTYPVKAFIDVPLPQSKVPIGMNNRLRSGEQFILKDSSISSQFVNEQLPSKEPKNSRISLKVSSLSASIDNHQLNVNLKPGRLERKPKKKRALMSPLDKLKKNCNI